MRRAAPARPRWRRRVLWTLLALLLVAGALGWGVIRIGHWLIVADPLERADAIVVLTGHLPFRAVEAASLFKAGWAPRVWLTRGNRPEEEAALARLGIQLLHEDTYSRQALERLGVPPHAIGLLKGRALNTVRELELVASELRRMGSGRAILVTSKAHSRRVRATWRARFPDLDARVRHAAGDPYDPDRWWRTTRASLDVSREVFGLLNVWAGFLVKPERR